MKVWPGMELESSPELLLMRVLVMVQVTVLVTDLVLG